MDSVSEVRLDLPGGSFVLLATVAAFAQIERDAAYVDAAGTRVTPAFQDLIATMIPPKTIDETVKLVALFATHPDASRPTSAAQVLAAMGSDLGSIPKANAAIMEALYAALPKAGRKRMADGAPDKGGGGDAPADPQ